MDIHNTTAREGARRLTNRLYRTQDVIRDAATVAPVVKMLFEDAVIAARAAQLLDDNNQDGSTFRFVQGTNNRLVLRLEDQAEGGGE